MAASADEQLDRDPEAMQEAVHLAPRSRRVLDLAGACEDAAVVFAARERTPEVEVMLAEAFDWYEKLGADWFAARASAGLRGFGVRRGIPGRRPRALTGWESLTRSERAVADLVAEGLTNREIGRRLFISEYREQPSPSPFPG